MKKYNENLITSDGRMSSPNSTPVNPEDLGNIAISPKGSFEAGSFQTFNLIYTAGKYGVDDSGSLRICFRFASDQSKPQFDDPEGYNYTKIFASNGALLTYRYDPKGNVRPWDKTLYIKVVEGFLTEGDTITIMFGDTSEGSPGMRLQTFCEDSYEFHTLVDPIATFCYQPMPKQPEIQIIPGKPDRYVAVGPTICEINEKFVVKIKGEDMWGNPSNKCDGIFYPKSNVHIKGLPKSIKVKEGEFFYTISGLTVSKDDDFIIDFLDEDEQVVFSTNPIKSIDQPTLRYFWADLHGQSEETIGTGSAEQYFAFARDLAFVDATGHQGNDFQMSDIFWKKLDNLCKEFDSNGRFVAIPGYEWSGNTSLGGDRNVFFPKEGRKIRRSSHALISDNSDLGTDCDTARDLFEAFAKNNEFDVVCYAHCGGRYADIKFAHDGRFEKSVEVHSSWGTFDWLVEDAFKLGYRVGIVANSDGHKGRPGASYPGAGLFGAIGGLTCFLTKELSRNSIMDCMKKRRHYATTGGPTGRPFLDLGVEFSKTGTIFHDDPRCSNDIGYASMNALMGDIVNLPSGEVKLKVTIKCNSPIERVDIFNGLTHLETIRPYGKEELGSRIRVLWSGAEYRGRFRQVVWDGQASISENKLIDAKPINFLNKDKKLKQVSDNKVEWRALTTGNLGGVDLFLENIDSGALKIDTPLIKIDTLINEIGLDDTVFENNGVLPRSIKIFRLPNVNNHKEMTILRNINITDVGDNPVFIRFAQEDGTICWSSPIYIFR